MRGIIMPEIFDVVLWCAALATWLMLLFAFLSKALKPLSKSVRRVIAEAFKPNLK
ncbi:hypothetical protein NK6_6239 [Bradyrhizobium diazoefficiens]|uniref:Uncharacterized protein n=1 Tax=Bradyrhizobium diazoefficiens TaxID=1355477 RepID=A0A0E4BSX4_9BRAD|nr:hypothetical protein NK6_6239 [Bradyrhizobium diazoefficiens]